MRILWLSSNPGFYNELENHGSYNGLGWISSLFKLLVCDPNITLGYSFVCHEKLPEKSKENTYYFPIYEKPKTHIEKIAKYYNFSKGETDKYLIDAIINIIEKFKPDVIHLFGLENQLACLLGNTNVPVIVHLQGLLSPYENAFWPIGFNKASFAWPPTIREWVYRNGYIYANKEIKNKARREIELFKKMKYCMGRTDWDYQVSRLLSPNSIYFKVNEVLRLPFYSNMGKWSSHNGKFIITSTLSETIYKGLDLVLKTADLLKKSTSIDFEWRVIGINTDSRFVNFFERGLNIKSKNVNVSYWGVLDASHLVDELLKSSVYVHTSYIDNSPNSVCEAQLVGVPVIACNVGGVSTLLDNGNAGTLVPANSPYELSYHLQKIANNDNYYEGKRQNALLLSEKRHDKTDIIEVLKKVYSKVLED